MVYDKDRSGLMEMEELHHFIKASAKCPSVGERVPYKLLRVRFRSQERIACTARRQASVWVIYSSFVVSRQVANVLSDELRFDGHREANTCQCFIRKHRFTRTVKRRYRSISRQGTLTLSCDFTERITS